MKLSDTQLIVLSAAAQREDRGIALPPKLLGGAAQKFAAKLLREGLVEEVRARGALPVWRRDDANGSMALRMSRSAWTYAANGASVLGLGVSPDPAPPAILRHLRGFGGDGGWRRRLPNGGSDEAQRYSIDRSVRCRATRRSRHRAAAE